MTQMDTRARATAKRLLDKYGKACTLTRIVTGTYDPETSTYPETVTTYPIKLYLDEPNHEDLSDGQVVKTDEVALFAALGLAVEPQDDDTITVDGRVRQIKRVGRVWSGEQVALWRVALKS